MRDIGTGNDNVLWAHLNTRSSSSSRIGRILHVCCCLIRPFLLLLLIGIVELPSWLFLSVHSGHNSGPATRTLAPDLSWLRHIDPQMLLPHPISQHPHRTMKPNNVNCSKKQRRRRERDRIECGSAALCTLQE